MSKNKNLSEPKKYRRIDRRCPCGGQAYVCSLIVGGRERVKWHCEKCDTYWNKGEARKMEKVFVT